MKRVIRWVIVVFFVLVVLTGCNDKVTAPPTADVPPSVDVPPKEESTGSSVAFTKSIHVKVGEVVTLDGDYSLKDKIVIKADDISGTRSLIQTNDGKMIPIPTEDNKISFDPADLGITTEGDVLIGQFINKDDFTMTAKERMEMSLNYIYDEYYYVDLTSPEFSGLDKSNIYIRQTQLSGNKGFSVFSGKGVVRGNDLMPFNMSGEDGFGLYQFYSGQTRREEDPACSLYLRNPIELKAIGDKKKLDDSFSIIKVSAISDEELCVVLSNVDEELMDKIFKSSIFPRTNPAKVESSKGKRGLVVPHYLSVSNEIVYYLGTVDEDTCFDINLTEFEDELMGSDLTVKLVSKKDYPDIVSFDSFFDLSSVTGEGTSFVAPDIDSKYITLTFKTNGTFRGNLETELRSTLYLYELNEGSYGSMPYRSGPIQITSSKETVLYMIIENSKIPESGNIGTFTLREEVKAKVGHNYVFDPATEGYKCTKHNDCYSYIDGTELIELFSDIFENGKYTTTTEIEGFDELWTERRRIRYSKSVSPNNNSLGNSSSDGRYVLKSLYDDAILIYEIASFDYVSETDRTLSGELIIQQNGVETHRLKDVVFTYTT